ncbi:MAG: hypothetical protein AAF682_22215 [Planctomycetota bacterium]
MRLICASLAPLVWLAGACSSSVPSSPPPLAGMEEPLLLRQVVEDEQARRALPAGTFSGLVLGDARDTLDALLDGPAGVEVVRVVENSPGDAAGIETGDLLLEARLANGTTRALAWPSDWRDIELSSAAGDTLGVVLDRAGVELLASFELEQRVRPADAPDIERFREEERVGIVVRTATETEARGAGLPPGAGAVVVGLSRESPWRAAGLKFGDLLVAADGAPVRHPAVVLQAARGGGDRVRLEGLRGGTPFELDAPLSRRVHELQSVSVPLLFSYENQRGTRTLSAVLGLLHWRRTSAAWRLRLLWVISMGGGDADRLREVDA